MPQERQKTCNKCGLTKSLHDFHRQHNSPDGHRYSCKSCANTNLSGWRERKKDHYRKKMKEWRERNRDKLKQQAQSPERKAYLKKWRQRPEVKEKAARRLRDYRKSNPEKSAFTLWKSNLRRLYGVTPEWYFETLEKQGGRCAVCRTDVPSKNPKVKRFAVDHCHETGHVRGLLCGECNVGIGKMKHDPEILRAALKYLSEN